MFQNMLIYYNLPKFNKMNRVRKKLILEKEQRIFLLQTCQRIHVMAYNYITIIILMIELSAGRSAREIGTAVTDNCMVCLNDQP